METSRTEEILKATINGESYDAPPQSRIEALLLRLKEVIEESGGGTTIKYGGRVDTVDDLPEEGEPNQFYFVGPETASNWEEYLWAVPTEGETGHWDRLGSVSIIIDDHLDPNSSNPVQNGIIAAAFTAVNNAINAVNTALAAKADKTEIPDISHKLEQKAIAAEYDSTHVYADGEYFTFNGELYEADSTADYILSENLVTAESKTTEGGFIFGSCPDTSVKNNDVFKSNWAYRTLGYISVTPGATYRFTPNGTYTTFGNVGDAYYSDIGVRVNAQGVSSNDPRTFTAGSNVNFVRFYLGPEDLMPRNNVRLQQVYTSMPKARKTAIAAELAGKADMFTIDPTPTDGSSNPVSSDGVYVALANKIDISSVDSALSPTSTNPVQNKVIAGKINEIMEIIEDKTIIYGWSVNPNESNPATAVEYLADAVGKTPAAMGSTVFSYGGWANAFFMPKPCMLKFDGTVDYYLDPNDYSKKLDGAASDIGNLSYGGNAMMEWPLIWYKFESGKTEGEGRFYCSNKQVDESYKCWCNVNSENDVVEHFYTPIYNGIIRDNKMRSLSGFRLTPTIAAIPAYDNTATYAVGALTKVSNIAYTCITPVSTAEEFDSSKWEEITPNNSGNTTGQQEVDSATANNTTSTVEWYTEVLSDRMLISALLILMSKNLDDQAVFGRGLDTGGQSAKEAYVTGTLDSKGLFWGVTANGNSAVKVFGMENFYACNWRRTAGLIGATVDSVNKFAYKLTYGTADGSTAAAYGSSSTGYLIADITRPSADNYVQKMKIGAHGILPVLVSSIATSSTYWGFYFYTGMGYARFGGNSYDGQDIGSLYVTLGYGFSASNWGIGAALSCKPKKAV